VARGKTSACAAASRVRLPRSSGSWSADTSGFPQIPDDEPDSRLPTPPIGQGGLGRALAGSTVSSVRETTHRSVRISTSLSVPCAGSVRASVVTTALDPLRPPLGAWSVPGRLPPVARSKRTVARAVVAASLGGGPRRPVVEVGPRLVKAGGRLLRRAKLALRRPVAPPRRSTSARPSGARGSPPGRVGARAPPRSLMDFRCPRGHRSAPRAARFECGGSEGLRLLTHRVEPASRRDSPKTALQDDRPRLRDAVVTQERSAHAALTRSRFSDSNMELRSSGSRPPRRGAPGGDRGLRGWTDRCRATTSLGSRRCTRGYSVRERSFGLGGELALATGLDPVSGSRAQGSSDCSDGLHRRSASRLPPDPETGWCLPAVRRAEPVR
jgi:hypothetical protein